MDAIAQMETDGYRAFAVIAPLLAPSTGTVDAPAWAALGMLAARGHANAHRLLLAEENTPHGRVAAAMFSLTQAADTTDASMFSNQLDHAELHLSQLERRRCDLAWIFRKAIAYGRAYEARHNLPAARQRLLWTAVSGVHVLDNGGSSDLCRDAMSMLSVMRLAAAGSSGQHGLLDGSYADLSLSFGGAPGDATERTMARLVEDTYLDRLGPQFARAVRKARAYREAGRLWDAAAVYGALSALRPRDAWEAAVVPCGLASLFDELGRTAEAVERYARCAEHEDVLGAAGARIALIRLDPSTRADQLAMLVDNVNLGMSAQKRLLVRTTWLAHADDAQVMSSTSLAAIRELPRILDQLFEDFGGSTWFAGSTLVELRPQLHRGARVLYENGERSAAFGVLNGITARSVFARRHRRDLAAAGDPVVRRALAQLQAHALSAPLEALQRGAPALDAALLRHAQLERQTVLTMAPLPPLPTLSELQRDLNPRDVRISYHGAGSELLIGVTTVDDFRLVNVDVGDGSLREDAAVLSDLASARGARRGANTRRRLHDLYNRLFVPIASWIPADAVLWVAPDHILHGVPFEALLTAPLDDDRPWSEAAFLGDRHLIAILPSGSWPTRTLPRSQKTPSALLVGVEGGAGGPPLPGVRTELAAVAAQGSGWPAARRCDGCRDKPTVGGFLRRAHQYDVIHVATHADSRSHPALRPLGVSLAHLWLRDDSDRAAQLWEHRVQTMVVDAELVFLNACQTISGDSSELEGAMGLSTAFLIAGADTVVSTRWAVHDELAATFAAAFYETYAEERRKSPATRSTHWKLQAMRNARDAIRATGQHAPQHWSAHVLSGSTQ
jgi:CHAT domain-containing protein